MNGRFLQRMIEIITFLISSKYSPGKELIYTRTHVSLILSIIFCGKLVTSSEFSLFSILFGDRFLNERVKENKNEDGLSIHCPFSFDDFLILKQPNKSHGIINRI